MAPPAILMMLRAIMAENNTLAPGSTNSTNNQIYRQWYLYRQ
jgi:hypothetical protein